MMKESEGRSNLLTGLLINNRWIWHLGFWVGYAAYRAWSYYLTLLDFREYLNFMLIRDLVFFVIYTYLLVGLYKLFIYKKRYALYFFSGVVLSMLHLLCVLELQHYTVPSL